MSLAIRGRVVARFALSFALLAVLSAASLVRGDGKVVRPRDYKGSLEERAQEAIIVFHESEKPGEATEDLILKITVAGDVDKFAWVVPLPATPETKAEDAAIFKELFDYVQARLVRRSSIKDNVKNGGGGGAFGDEKPAVEVIKREIVGSYDVAVVKENEPGKLNAWLEAEGYQPLADGKDIIEFYRDKGYVFACVKVADAQLTKRGEADLHPLRFTFKTGGRDGIYFPMRMTGLQSEPFDVNLYVFYRYWINDRLSPFGYVHRGFDLTHRDWDTAQCVPSGGKAYSSPKDDPFLGELAGRLKNVATFFQKRYPGEKFYLTNIQARQLKPADVREWVDDLWLFPYYTDRQRVPFDAAPDGPAAGAYKNVQLRELRGEGTEPLYTLAGDENNTDWRRRYAAKASGAAIVVIALAVIGFFVVKAIRPRSLD